MSQATEQPGTLMRPPRRRWRSLGALAVGASALLAACGGAAAAAHPAGHRAHGSGAGGAVPLVVYSAQGYDANTVAAFQKATGIPTLLVDDSTGPLLARIQAERNNPQWGVLWVDGNQPFAALDLQHLLLRGFEPPAAWSTVAQTVIPPDHSYIPTGLTMAAALVYNSAKLRTPPTTWQQLLEPRYRGLLGMNNPAISGPTYPFVAGMMSAVGGVQPGERFFRRLKANGLQVFPTNGDSLHALQIGQIDMAAIQSSAIFGAIQADPRLKVVFPKPVTLLPGNIGIDANASSRVIAEAKRFAEFVLSPAGQHQMQAGDPHGDSLFWPVLRGEQPNPGIPAMTSIAYQTINPYWWGPREGVLNQWFTTTIAG